MKKITVVGLDLAKSVFQVHGIAEEGDVIVRRTSPHSPSGRQAPRGVHYSVAQDDGVSIC